MCSITGLYTAVVDYTVTNIGTAPVLAQEFIEFTSVFVTPGYTNVPIISSGGGQYVPGGLPANGGQVSGSFIIVLGVQPPFAECPGGVDMVTTLNVDNYVEECPGGDANNTAKAHFCCSSRATGLCPEPCTGPDLKTASVEASCECESYERLESQGTTCMVTAHVLVTNSGSADAGNFRVSIDSSLGNGEATVFGLPAGNSKMVDIEFSFDGDMGACPLDLEVTVDARGQIAECDETNNVSTASACCQ
jgi:hypothetical protein